MTTCGTLEPFRQTDSLDAANNGGDHRHHMVPVPQRVVPTVLALLASLVMSVSLSAEPPATLADVLARAGAYVDAFNRDLASIVAEEHYVQVWRRPSVMHGVKGDVVTRRELRSDLMLVKPAPDGDWLQYRDVFDVDGVPIRDRAERLTRLFLSPSASTDAQVARIQQESARHNLGDIERNLNTPLFALQFLDRANQRHFSFRRTDERTSRSDNAASSDTGAFRVSTEVWVVRYEETSRPTIVHTADDKDVPARGRFWIEPDTGRVLMSELSVGDRQRTGTVTVSYQSEPVLGLLVPIEMREQYEERRSRSRIEGAATYGRFRQFSVQVDERVDSPAGAPTAPR